MAEAINNRDYQLPPIDKNIPIPQDALHFDKRSIPRSPWPDYIRSMDVGDSFIVNWGQASRLRQHFAFMGIPCVYSVLKDSRSEHGTVNVRIWRIG